MKTSHILCLSLSFALCANSFAQMEDVDRSLSDLAEKLAVPIKEHSRKKVTVLDFTTLQNEESELGRYIAEQLTINLVMAKREFSVLDRANLKKILAEHKLTATGLVDPENAKKLGQFAGVDAIILGTITPIGTNIQLTAKIITTDTAEIIGAAKAKVPLSRDVELLLTNTVAKSQFAVGDSVQTPDAAKALQVEKNSQRIGDLLLKIESVRAAEPPYGYQGARCLLATIFFANMNSSNSVVMAVTDDWPPSKLTNKRGDEFKAGYGSDWLSGLGVVGRNIVNAGAQFTTIPPGKSAKVAIKHVGFNDASTAYPPYRLTLPIIIGDEVGGRNTNIKKVTFMLDVEEGK